MDIFFFCFHHFPGDRPTRQPHLLGGTAALVGGTTPQGYEGGRGSDRTGRPSVKQHELMNNKNKSRDRAKTQAPRRSSRREGLDYCVPTSDSKPARRWVWMLGRGCMWMDGRATWNMSVECLVRFLRSGMRCGARKKKKKKRAREERVSVLSPRHGTRNPAA